MKTVYHIVYKGNDCKLGLAMLDSDLMTLDRVGHTDEKATIIGNT